MAKPTEEYLQMIVSDLVEIVEEDMAYYLGHEPCDQEEWDEEERMAVKMLEVLKTMVEEKWPKRK